MPAVQPLPTAIYYDSSLGATQGESPQDSPSTYLYPHTRKHVALFLLGCCAMALLIVGIGESPTSPTPASLLAITGVKPPLRVPATITPRSMVPPKVRWNGPRPNRLESTTQVSAVGDANADMEKGYTQEKVEGLFDEMVTRNKIMMFSSSRCKWCDKAAALFTDNQLAFGKINMEEVEGGAMLYKVMTKKTGSRTVPQIYISGEHVGGWQELVQLVKTGKFDELYMKDEIEAASGKFEEMIKQSPVFIVSGTYCPYCHKAKEYLDEKGIAYKAIDIDVEEEGPIMAMVASSISGLQTIPNIWVNGLHLGGYDALTSTKLDMLLERKA